MWTKRENQQKDRGDLCLETSHHLMLPSSDSHILDGFCLNPTAFVCFCPRLRTKISKYQRLDFSPIRKGTSELREKDKDFRHVRQRNWL